MAHNTLTQEDEAYLAQHPAVRDLVRCIVCECLRKRPEDPVDHIRKFVAQRDLARSVSLTRAARAFSAKGHTLAAVARHNTPQDAWIAVRGKVYEVSHFFAEHPGGAKPLSMGIGKDATKMFEGVHSYVNPDKRLNDFYLGPLLAQPEYRAGGYTMEEVAKHNTPDDAWTVVRGKVYDITEWLGKHPGGSKPLLRVIGRDATPTFDMVHKGVDPDEALPGKCLGPLVVGRAEEDEAKATPASDDSVALSKQEFRPFELVAREAAGVMTTRFTFALPAGQRLGLHTGQALLVRVEATDGEWAQRAYTPVSELHQTDTFDLCIKVYETGRVSGAMGKLAVGDVVLMKGPIGRMSYSRGTVTIGGGESRRVRRFNLLAGGSGITPMLQLMRSIASDPEDRTEVTLLDSNTRRDMVIMKAALDRIAAASCGRMTVHYFTTDARDPSPPLEVDPPSFSHAGRIDQAAMQHTLFPPDPATMVCVCGPKSFVTAMEAAAAALGHSETNVFTY